VLKKKFTIPFRTSRFEVIEIPADREYLYGMIRWTKIRQSAEYALTRSEYESTVSTGTRGATIH
jgi:hypothetical protein